MPSSFTQRQAFMPYKGCVKALLIAQKLGSERRWVYEICPLERKHLKILICCSLMCGFQLNGKIYILMVDFLRWNLTKGYKASVWHKYKFNVRKTSQKNTAFKSFHLSTINLQILATSAK